MIKDKVIDMLLILLAIATVIGVKLAFIWGVATIIMALCGQRSFFDVFMAVGVL